MSKNDIKIVMTKQDIDQCISEGLSSMSEYVVTQLMYQKLKDLGAPVDGDVNLEIDKKYTEVITEDIDTNTVTFNFVLN